MTSVDIDHAANAIREADILLTQLETPVPTVHHALELARARQHPHHPQPRAGPSAGRSALSLVDIIVPNEHEAATLTGIDTSTHSRHHRRRPRAAKPRLPGRYHHSWRMRCMIVEDESTYLPQHQVAALDTVAAGDASSERWPPRWRMAHRWSMRHGLPTRRRRWR